MNKGFIFSGDSFVWGEGLELFSNLPSTYKYFRQRKYSMESEDGHNRAWNPEYKNSMRMFQQKNRFARLVANHFDTWEDVYDRNGGCPYTIIDELFTQINRTPLTDVASIIIHPSDPWRSVDIYSNPNYNGIKSIKGIHPSSKYFQSFRGLPPGNLSQFSLSKPIPYFGTNRGFDKYKDIITENYFSLVENNFLRLLTFCVSYDEYKKGNRTLETAIEDCYLPIDTSDDAIKKYDIYYDFCKLELSQYGNTFEKIINELEIKLCRDFIQFIEKHIKPNADKYGVNISFLPVWNERWVSYKNAKCSFYNDNIIEIYKDGKYYPSFSFFWQEYMIEKTKGYEWTNNMHPNLEGHKLIANSIIDYFKRKNILEGIDSSNNIFETEFSII